LEVFDGDDLYSNQECLEAYFLANNVGQAEVGAIAEVLQVSDRNKVATIISLIGNSTNTTLKDLCLLEIPSAKTYEQLCSCVTISCPNDDKPITFTSVTMKALNAWFSVP